MCIIIIVCITISCINRKDNKGLRDNAEVPEAKEQKQERQEEDGDEEEPDYKKLREKFISSYDKVVNIDTILFVDHDSYRIHLKYYCLFDSAVKIPNQFIWEGAKHEFVTHDFVSDIYIIENDDTIYSSTIKKETFDSILTEILKDYGVLLFPSFRGFNKDTRELVFHFSVSIPVTDIGTSATLYVDLKGDEKIKQY